MELITCHACAALCVRVSNDSDGLRFDGTRLFSPPSDHRPRYYYDGESCKKGESEGMEREKVRKSFVGRPRSTIVPNAGFGGGDWVP